ncbi:MAG: LSU ribosomal protein L25p [Nitrospira sp.]|jgi:large subunit ribosomal protein L25|nr:MAG: LSU ribosomal protein L25p [Nitrospira sp.]
MKFELTVESRVGGGKGPARQLRRAGKVPAVLYGQGECLLLSVNPDELVKILRSQAGSTALISITVNGAKTNAKRTALLRDYQVDPVAGNVLHADFFEILMDKPIRVKVPVHLTGGQPLGLKEGGVLHHVLRELHVECLPSLLPDFIDVDASQLQINQGIHLKDIRKADGLRFLDDPDHMVVSIAAPITDAKLEALLTTGAPGAEGAKEPEVVAKGKAAAEGAAGAEGAGKAGEAKAGAPAAAAKTEKKEPEKKK